MKLIGLLLLGCSGGILLWVALTAGQQSYMAPRPPQSVPVALTGEVPEGFVVRTLEVDGMCCQGCAAKLYAALGAVSGVREAAVDAAVGEASVVLPPDVEVALLESALTFEAYTAELRN